MSSSKKQRTATNEPLRAKQVRAIELRYEGLTYKKIGEEIATPESTVEKWFAPSYDLLHADYIKYAESQNIKRLSLADEKMKRLITKAMDTVESLIDFADKDSVRLHAAEAIIERNMGKTVQRIEIAGAEQLERTGKALDKLLGLNDNNPTS